MNTEGQVKVAPEQILDRRTTTQKKKKVEQVLLKWLNLAPEDATWEDVTVMQSQFPEFFSS